MSVRKTGDRHHNLFLAAIVLITAGIVLLLFQMGILDRRVLLYFWPVTFLLVGMTLMIKAPKANHRMFGLIVILLGVVIRFGYLWPLLAILGGLLMMRHAWMRNGRRVVPLEFPGTAPHASSVTPPIRRITTIFGGFKLDLTRADLHGDEAVIEANTFCGGGEIIVSRNWGVTLDGLGEFGGYTDKTQRAQAAASAPPRNLILRGTTFVGEVVVRN